MKKGYHLATVEPVMGDTTATSTAYADNDWLFGWTAFEIPKGTCAIRTMNVMISGTNGVDANAHDIQLYYARSIDGVAPTNLAVENAAITEAGGMAAKNNIIGYSHLDLSATTDSGKIPSYIISGSRTASGADNTTLAGSPHNVILQGDLAFKSASGPGFQTVFLGGIARGAFDFGTAVLLNMGGNQAASTAAVQITTDGTDPRKCFQPGDQLIGHTKTVTMEVVSVDSATTMTVKNVSAQIDDDEELIPRSPIKFYIGLEY
tara:strand:- start:224 stop:1009 length:786 start_codon:yes stop_codon:yes gene_type:complete